MNRKHIGIVLALVAGGFLLLEEQGLIPHPGGSRTGVQTGTGPSDNDLRTIADAYRSQRSDVQVRGVGTVEKVLRDDLEGSRHQRFLLRLENNQTLLVAHNIDLAPRVQGLRKGDQVGFFGEYEWNKQGGVLHWTHHDPARRHVGGWLKHGGRTYQ